MQDTAKSFLIRDLLGDLIGRRQQQQQQQHHQLDQDGIITIVRRLTYLPRIRSYPRPCALNALQKKITKRFVLIKAAALRLLRQLVCALHTQSSWGAHIYNGTRREIVIANGTEVGVCTQRIYIVFGTRTK